MTPQNHSVSVQMAKPRGIAAVRARMPGRHVPVSFTAYLDQVYSAARANAMPIDGQNVFVYRGGVDVDEVDVEFGVGVMAPFPPVGPVQYAELPVGAVASTTHWGDYGRLGEAHAAIVAWCGEHGHTLAGPRWEVYGHWSADPASRRTDVYYLLETADRRP